jgi:transposase InsO family protein
MGTEEQSRCQPSRTVLGCTRKATTALNTVTVATNVGLKSKLRLLIDTGAELCLLNCRSLKDGTGYRPGTALNVRGISSKVERTLGEVDVKLMIGNYEIEHKFHIVGEGIDIPYDGVLGKDFFESNQATIDYLRKEICMGRVIWGFDQDRWPDWANKEVKVMLEPRCETVIRLPTGSRELQTGLIDKMEVAPGVIIARTLTVVRGGACLASVVNTNDEQREITLPWVNLEQCDDETIGLRVGAINIQQEIAAEGRWRELRKKLRIDHLNDEERRSVVRICEEYSDIFYLPTDRLTTTTAVEHVIPTPSIDPCRGIASRNYRIPEALKGELKQITQQMLRDKIIRHSTSPWNAPIILVKKKEDASGKQKWRLVVDFRKLNEVTVGDSFPLPLISEILDALGKARYFTTADLASGFHQVPLREEDRHKTAFSTPDGHFEYCSMPMGICSAPATFQRLMTKVLSGLTGSKALIYLDDVIVWGASLREHNDRLIEVFDRLRLHSLKLQPDKCEFLRKEVCYLGHRVTPRGVRPDDRKVAAVKDYPVPHNTKQLKSFLGLAGYYRKFVPNFSPIARPLHKLTGKNIPFIWGEEQELAFRTLKDILCSEPLLQYPDFNKEFIVTCDASSNGIGSVLSQGIIGKDLPIAYASRVLTTPEQNYSTIERELTAIVWACKQFRPYIWGRKFTIVTDHKPLTWIFRMNDPSSRIMRLKLKLEEFEYTIVYKKGKENSNSDGLSRMYIGADESKRIEMITGQDSGTPEGQEAGKKGLDDKEKAEILREMHDSPIGGHVGMNRTYKRLRHFINWEGMKHDVERYIQKCEKCQKNKMTQCHTRLPLVITDTPSSVFEKCTIDIVGPLNYSATGNRYILTIQDDLSKFLIAVPLTEQTADEVAKAFVENVILIYGTPRTVLSDCGSQFLSETFKGVCKLLGIKKTQTTSWHPQSNGSNERSHKGMVEYIRSYVAADSRDWDQWVRYAAFVHNTTPHRATGHMPFQLLFGRLPNLPGALQKEPISEYYAYDNYVKELEARLTNSYAMARRNLEMAKLDNKRNYDRRVFDPKFEVGSKVLVQDESVRRGRSKKLGAAYVGPYEVIRVEGPNLVLRTRKGREMKIHANRAKLFFT